MWKCNFEKCNVEIHLGYSFINAANTALILDKGNAIKCLKSASLQGYRIEFQWGHYMRNMAEVEINVGGTIFLTTFQTLSKIQETRLSSLKRDIALDKCITKFFFDRNPEMFNSILDLYRTGELHFPSNFCGATIRNELEFWEIDKKYVSECCLASLYRHDDDLDILKEIKNLQNGKALDIPKEECRDGCWRDCLWKVLQYPATSRKASVSLYKK